MNEKILLAGATGYLGRYILAELLQNGYFVRIIVRNKSQISPEIQKLPRLEIIQAQITCPESLENVCKGIDKVISCVGITRQKDGLSYMQVDFQANKNLLDEAVRQGVKKFVYVSVFKGRQIRHTAVGEAKERFVDTLKASGMNYCIVRPTGFYSDIGELFQMAKKSGKISLFGSGNLSINPIHGEDLAKICVRQIHSDEKEVDIGGKEVFTQNEIAELAFSVLGKKPKIAHYPDWMRKLTLKVGKILLPKSVYGKIEFFLTTIAMEMTAPETGSHTLRAYFEELNI